MFPSPVGELHFSIITERQGGAVVVKFPSPVGELHFAMVRKINSAM